MVQFITNSADMLVFIILVSSNISREPSQNAIVDLVKPTIRVGASHDSMVDLMMPI